MKVLLIGETGTGKTFLSLHISQFFETAYVDTEDGIDEWIESGIFKFDKKFRVTKVLQWSDSFRVPVKELVVIDSVSELMEHYKDYLQEYIRREKKFPMPNVTGIVDLEQKGYDTDKITLPVQLYQLVYDTILNVVSEAVRYNKNLIVTMHPIETRTITMDGKIVHSKGRLEFLQGLHRKFDCVLVLKNPEEGIVKKIRGRIMKDNKVNAKQFLEKLFKIGGGGNSENK